jgi:hypothetical protein
MEQMRQIRFVIFSALLLNLSALAQNRQRGSYTVYLNNPSGSIKAEVVFENKPLKAKEELTYSWYASNKIMETRGGYDGRMLDGAYTSYYLSDNLKEQGVYKNGLKDEEWKAWFENGKLKEISNWDDGVKSGVYKKFDSRGNLVTQSYYRNGKLNGYEILYEGEKIISKKKYKRGEEIIPKAKKVIQKDSAETRKGFHLFRKPDKEKAGDEKKDESPKEKKVKENTHKEKKDPLNHDQKPLAKTQPKEKRAFLSKWTTAFKKDKKKKNTSVAANEKSEK